MIEPGKFSDFPTNAVSRAADAALEAALAQASSEGVRVVRMLVLVDCEDTPEGEPPGCTSAWTDDGDPTPGDVLAILMEHLDGVATAMGGEVHFMAMPSPPGRDM